VAQRTGFYDQSVWHPVSRFCRFISREHYGRPLVGCSIASKAGFKARRWSFGGQDERFRVGWLQPFRPPRFQGHRFPAAALKRGRDAGRSTRLVALGHWRETDNGRPLRRRARGSTRAEGGSAHGRGRTIAVGALDRRREGLFRDSVRLRPRRISARSKTCAAPGNTPKLAGILQFLGQTAGRTIRGCQNLRATRAVAAVSRLAGGRSKTISAPWTWYERETGGNRSHAVRMRRLAGVSQFIQIRELRIEKRATTRISHSLTR